MKLESKHADIKAKKGDCFYYLWSSPDEAQDEPIKKVSVEYIPENWPQVVVSITDQATNLEAQISHLKDAGWEIEE